MCALAPASPPPLDPADPELLPELEALEPPPDPELAPDPDPDVEPPLVDDVPELLPCAFDPASGAEDDPPLEPHPLKTPNARTRPANAVGARSKALMDGEVTRPWGSAPESRTGLRSCKPSGAIAQCYPACCGGAACGTDGTCQNVVAGLGGIGCPGDRGTTSPSPNDAS